MNEGERSRTYLAFKHIAYAGLGPERAFGVAARMRDARSAVEYRLRADGRRSRARLKSFRNRFSGERCFIVGSGPSLLRQDLTRLRGEHVLSLNRGYLILDELNLRPTFHVCVNDLLASQLVKDLTAVKATKLYSWSTRRHFAGADDDLVFVRTMDRIHFSRNPSRGVWEGSTVTFVALQLAFYFGFDPVVLIGVDHHFTTPGSPNEVITQSEDDRDHFSPHYMHPGMRWQLPDLARSELAYGMARTAYEGVERSVLDATHGGKLEVFDKVDFDSLF